jgi:hypothetical protein
MIWISNEMFAIEMDLEQSNSIIPKQTFAIYKRKTGKLAATITDVVFHKNRVPLRNEKSAGIQSMAVCMIDKRSTKCYDTTLEAIYQLGKPIDQLNFSDLDERENRWFKKIKVIGDTAPACFARKINEFYQERPDNKIKARDTEENEIKSLK